MRNPMINKAVKTIAVKLKVSKRLFSIILIFPLFFDQLVKCCHDFLGGDALDAGVIVFYASSRAWFASWIFFDYDMVCVFPLPALTYGWSDDRDRGYVKTGCDM